MESTCDSFISPPIGYLFSAFVVRMRACLGTEDQKEQSQRPLRNRGNAHTVIKICVERPPKIMFVCLLAQIKHLPLFLGLLNSILVSSII